MLHAIVMAGGAGTRFWPESRAARPKQLLDFVGGRTMIQATVDRLGTLVPPERVLVVTNQSLVEPIRSQLPQLPPDAILGEPCKRDTAPCIGWAALHVLRDDPQATMAVMPSDHVIRTDEAFQQALRLAADLVEAEPARIVTFGIKPTYPAETFGYIERGDALELALSSIQSQPSAATQPGPAVYAVRRFREKPKAPQAREFVDAGNFYWNSGIFVWKASTILDELRQRRPALVRHLERIDDAWRHNPGEYRQVLEAEFAAIESISIDFAVMEHARNVLVIEAPFEWDDVGSWQALARLRGVDEHGNTLAGGKHLGLRTTGTIIRASGDHLIVTLGLADCIVVHTPDATLVANKHDEESIRELVKLMAQRGWSEYL
jgi:mannose-1-phosphate guanylyltransferase